MTLLTPAVRAPPKVNERSGAGMSHVPPPWAHWARRLFQVIYLFILLCFASSCFVLSNVLLSCQRLPHTHWASPNALENNHNLGCVWRLSRTPDSPRAWHRRRLGSELWGVSPYPPWSVCVEWTSSPVSPTPSPPCPWVRPPTHWLHLKWNISPVFNGWIIKSGLAQHVYNRGSRGRP